jgi:serine/threonine protein kinase/ABC-type branched-subunit amino acid transport system substrate-binding protein
MGYSKHSAETILTLRSGKEEYALINNNFNDDTEMNWPSSYLGNYRLVRLLGRGGFASVYLGEHQYLKRLAAIKLLRAVLDDPDRVRFLIEAKLLANLSHPHIVRVLEFAVARRRMVTQNSVTIDNIPFLVMDYVASGSLRTIYPTGTYLSLDTVVTYIKQAAEALQYAHERHVIHRDIKPENLLLNDQQEVMLSDFGLALFAPRPGFLSQQEMAGTVPYTAPEQLRGKPVFASDQYSLAIVAYEWLCGQPPFTGVDAEVMISHFSSAPPSLRSRNEGIPQAVEDVIMKALAKDPAERYATILAFAQALEQAGAKKRYPLVKVLPMSKVSPSSYSSEVSLASRSTKVRPFLQYLSQEAVSGPFSRDIPLRPRSRKKRKAALFLVSLSILLLAFVLYSVRPFFHPVSPVIALSLSGSTLLATIGVMKAPDGELIGVSDGTYIFDATGPDASLKEKAAQKLRQGDTGSAFSLLSEAHNMDTSDAEALIYQENIRAVNAKYITLVLGTTLTGDAASITVGHDNLQGAYIAQREYNDTAEQHGGVKVRLLIANTGSQTSYVAPVVQQVVRLAQKDKTIVGVMGWSVSAPAFAAIPQLSQAHIPMVSTAGGDNFTEISNYFFRVAAPAHVQAMVAAQYAMNTLKAKSAAIFLDPTNDYSRSLAEDFNASFASDGNTIAATETYTVGDATKNSQRLITELQAALSHHPDVIYFGGYPADVSVLLEHMKPSDPPVMGGNSFYELGAYSHVSSSGISHLRFTALAYPDEWDILHLSAQKPAFFMDYAGAFGPAKSGKSPYGYTRTDSGTMLAYDATLALLQASNLSLKNKYPLSGSDVQQALTELKGVNALQGVTGQIAFGVDGNPVNKAVTIVCNQGGLFKLDMVEGQFLSNGPLLTNYPGTSNCA